MRRWECQQAHAGKRTLHRFYAPVKRGFLGGKPCVRGTPFVPKLSRGCAPMRVFAYFLRVQKVGRPGGENPNPKDLPEPSGKRAGFWFLLARVKRNSPLRAKPEGPRRNRRGPCCGSVG